MPSEHISSLDEANHSVFDQDKALRIQPPAPAPTQYYFHEDGEWRLQKCGQSHSSSVDVEVVRKAVKRAIPKNNQAGGGGVRAVEKSKKDKYA
ncbi:hypothetical protein [Halorussus sp. AFM4]|uniref:hypothetical protein n=1 Tax=Halorussus sp. AFM4 TaxID=3421651 RepID=UPI003EB96DB7